MKNRGWILGVLAGYLIFAGCCGCPPVTEIADRAGQGDQCEGWGYESISTLRAIELRCNGDCPDGNPCRVMTSADSLEEWQWCGCPGQPEPDACHLVRYRLPGGDWRFRCSGPCPATSDTCLIRKRFDMQDTTRQIVSCECD